MATIYNTLPPTEIPLFPVICREFQLPISASSLKVCIIGAGISGLAAAQFLHQHGVQHVTVLESRLRMGGRIFTVHANGAAVELGAQYVQDHELNPVANICAQLELPTASFDPTEHHGLLQKMVISDEVFAPPPIEEAHGETNGDSSAPHSKRSQANGGDSPRELDDKPNTTDNGSGMHVDDIAADKGTWRSLRRFGTHPSNLSAQQSLESHDYTYTQSVMTSGLSEVVRNLGIGIDVRLGFSVETINYNSIYRSDSVLVRFKDDECQTHSEVFDVVLVTVPLGVLKAGKIRFEPPLPSSKQDALSRLAVGHQNVIALIFEYQFWERSETEPTVLYENEAKGICMVSMPHWGHRPVVQVSFFGDSAKVLESAQPDVLVPSLVETLRSNFKQVPKVVGYIWAPWSSDPNCLGAHSFVPKSENSSLRTALAEPLHLGRVGFAGEHTHTNHPSTLHGAYESGIREARRIIDLFTEKNVGEYVFPFESAVGATYSSDLPWRSTSEETEELQASILQGLPNMVVSIPPVDPCS
jgi:monoamine oxidase